MSKRLEKKNLQRKIFKLMHNMHVCFPEGEFANTPIPAIKAKSYFTRYTIFSVEHFKCSESYGAIETKARQFLKDVDTHHSADSFNRALYCYGPEFDDDETGYVDALTFYINKIDELKSIKKKNSF